MTATQEPSRRAVLVVAPALLLTACTAEQPAPTGVEPTPDPDVALAAAAADRERALLAAYDEVLPVLPALAARLAAVRAHHEEHLAALLAFSSSGDTGGPSATPTASAPTSARPATADTALARLVELERTSGSAHGQDCLLASQSLAGLLAQLSASELTHPLALA